MTPERIAEMNKSIVQWQTELAALRREPWYAHAPDVGEALMLCEQKLLEARRDAESLRATLLEVQEAYRKAYQEAYQQALEAKLQRVNEQSKTAD